ncbi:hypothetical protein BCR42DRAFT_489220 [Absidia repens]|uniref:Uncharacterized protein n=1 Tax=Absidia repens TaxID=90262 RepID=A0A1X2IR72_9FUNG|nr:hypothetical protein BCR42DRAFT_489220 [Absidia repens]
MSLMEPQSKPTSNRNRKKHHRHSFPVTATTSATPTSPHQQQYHEQQPSRRHSYHYTHHHQPQGRRYAKHRLSNASGTSFTSSSSTSSLTSFAPSFAPSFTHRPFNTFEIVFTNIVDALIFTSAIAITAYNYWMGYIVDPPRIYGSSSPAPCVMLKKLEIASPLPSSPSSSSSSSSSTTTPASSPASPLPSSSIIPPSPTNHHHRHSSHSLDSDLKRTTKIKAPELQTQHEKINTVNLSDDGSQEEEEEEEEEEDRVNRMEETLQELIRQGQAALTSPY